jgi:hypothetical protein
MEWHDHYVPHLHKRIHTVNYASELFVQYNARDIILDDICQ